MCDVSGTLALLRQVEGAVAAVTRWRIGPDPSAAPVLHAPTFLASARCAGAWICCGAMAVRQAVGLCRHAMRRVVSVWFPHRPTNRLQRCLPRSHEPLVTALHDGRRRVLAAANPVATSLGLHPGMAVAQALALSPRQLLFPGTHKAGNGQPARARFAHPTGLGHHAPAAWLRSGQPTEPRAPGSSGPPCGPSARLTAGPGERQRRREGRLHGNAHCNAGSCFLNPC